MLSALDYGADAQLQIISLLPRKDEWHVGCSDGLSQL